MDTNYNIIVVKGDSIRWEPCLYDINGNTYDYRGCTLYMEVRNGFYPSASICSYSLYVSNSSTLSQPEGLTGGISAATGGTLYICIGSSYANSLSIDRTCRYDIRAITPTLGDFTTILKGNLQVLPQITDI
jgi:hypothetical protein